MANEFKVHRLTPAGLQKADIIAEKFAALLADLDTLIPDGRERSLVVTKLQEACFFAKRSVALQLANQDVVTDFCRASLYAVLGHACQHGYTWQCPEAARAEARPR